MITLGLADEAVPAEWAGLGEADIDDVEKRRLAKHAAMQGRGDRAPACNKQLYRPLLSGFFDVCRICTAEE